MVKVSLVMPAFIRDAANLRYFEQALNSAIEQTYEALEILVVNDGSPLTAELERLPQLHHPRVRYVKKANAGVASALNVALKEMSGEFFTWLSHDDLYLPTKVEEQASVALAHRGDAVFYCDVEHIDEAGKHLFFELTPDIPPAVQYLFHAQYGCFNANSYLIHRRCFETVGPFDETLRTTQDNDMWFRIARHFTSIRVPKVLMKYRHHPTQDSRSPVHLGECNDLYIYFLKSVRREDIMRDPTRSVARYYAECACIRSQRGYRRAENHSLRLALREGARSPWRERSTLNLIAGLLLRRLRPGRWLLERIAPESSRDVASNESRVN